MSQSGSPFLVPLIYYQPVELYSSRLFKNLAELATAVREFKEAR